LPKRSGIQFVAWDARSKWVFVAAKKSAKHIENQNVGSVYAFKFPSHQARNRKAVSESWKQIDIRPIINFVSHLVHKWIDQSRESFAAFVSIVVEQDSPVDTIAAANEQR
jgi:hypothetical protein